MSCRMTPSAPSERQRLHRARQQQQRRRESRGPRTHAVSERRPSVFNAISAKRLREHCRPSPLTHSVTCCACLPDTQPGKCTFWGVEAQNTHTAKQLMTICTVLGRPAAPSQRAGAHVRSRRSKRGRVIPGLLPGKRESVCSNNTCMTRPVPRPTCQRREGQARDRQTELKNYSGIHRPRGLGSASTGEATLHRIPFLFQFCLWDANVTKLFGAVPTPDRAASPATDKSGPIV